ncbi:hypothetical protein Bbelb_278270 [Branchiostoma belcheri]|nr:hypothetical protein Bbelb_278270 [Branchiostoma belcheri]
MKSHVRRYVNEKHNVSTAKEMKEALESHGGVEGCGIAVAQMAPGGEYSGLKWEGVKALNNFQYEDDSIRVWRAYNIGTGELVPFSTQAVSEGWAIRKVKRGQRMSEKVKTYYYLTDIFNHGATSGQKADASQVSQDMQHARGEDGELLFEPSEWRGAKQISSYFARLSAAQRRQESPDSVTHEDIESLEKPHVDSSEQRLNSPAPTDHVAFWRANHSAQTGTRPPARPQRVESDAPPSQRHRLTICIFCCPAAARPASGIVITFAKKTRLEGGQTPPGLVSLPWNPNSLSGPQKPFARWCKLPLRGSLARGEFGWPDNANSPQAQLLRSAYQACRSVARPGKLPDGRLNIRRTRRPEDTEAEYRRRIRQESTAAEVRQESTAVEERAVQDERIDASIILWHELRPVVHDLIRKLSKRGVATRQVRQDDVLREIAGHVDGYESPRDPHAAVGDLILLEIQRRLFNTNNNDGEAS